MPSAPHTVLVVGTEPRLRRVVAGALADEGYDVLTAECAQEALAIIDSSAAQLALIVTDLDMPDVSGAALTTYLACTTSTPHLLFCSGVSGGIAAPENEASDTAIANPCVLRDLIHCVRGVLGLPAAGDYIRHSTDPFRGFGDNQRTA